MQFQKNLDVSVPGYGCIHRLAPRRYSAGEVGNVRKSLVCKKMSDTHGPSARVAHHDDLRIASKLSHPGRYLVHRHMYDAGDARKLQFPVFADVDHQRILAAIASGLELRGRDFANHDVLELKGFGALGIFQRIQVGLEQGGAVPCILGGARDQQGFLRRLIAADDHEKLPTHG
jgi:hypothetical protein